MTSKEIEDTEAWVKKEEVNEWMDKDPIDHVLDVIKEQGWMTTKEIEDTEAWVKKEVEESVAFAENSPYPAPEELYVDVYTQQDYPYIKEY